jgi:hypothetical protein
MGIHFFVKPNEMVAYLEPNVAPACDGEDEGKRDMM